MRLAGTARALYNQDFALCIEEQVAALRTGNVAGLDVANLTLELEGLTKRDVRALGSALKRIMAHMLKQRYQPQRASRSWAMTKNYPRAVSQAARDTRLPAETFPEQPPFGLADLLGDAP